MKIRIIPAVIFAAFLIASCSPKPETKAPCTETIGSICTAGEALGFEGLITRLRTADIVILGERHTAPEHHEWQARIVAALAPEGIAFEMIPRDKEAIANAARQQGTDIGEAVDWAASGWPDFALYRPIFDAAPTARIAGGGVPRTRLRAAMTEGAGAAAGAEGARYRLEEPLPPAVFDDMIAEQAAVHCSVLPEKMLPGMVAAQQLRDAAFADAALRLVEAGHGPAVLITGNGHARKDRGVPFYLRRGAPERKVLSVGMVEPGGNREAIPYDITIMTSPFDQGDVCAELREKFGKK